MERALFEGSISIELIYADDIAILVSRPCPRRIIEISGRTARMLLEILQDLGLSLGLPKSFNLVISPGLLAGPVFRRFPNPHMQRNRE